MIEDYHSGIWYDTTGVNSITKLSKSRRHSFIELSRRYTNDNDQCVSFFFKIKWPEGFKCKKCDATNYCFSESNLSYRCQKCHKEHLLLEETVFQELQMDLYRIILGMYFFLCRIPSYCFCELADNLEIDFPATLKLVKICRIIEDQGDKDRIIEILFSYC